MTRLNARFLGALTLILSAFLFPTSCQQPETSVEPSFPATTAAEEIINNLANLTDPSKLATLGERGANSRVRKIAYWLYEAQRSGIGQATALRSAFAINGFGSSEESELVIAVATENLEILRRLGCLTEEGLALLRRGNAPTITRGEDTGELATVDHIIPRSVCPELDNSLVNLKILSASENRRKSNSITKETVEYAKFLHSIGALSQVGLVAVENRAAPVAQVRRQMTPTRRPSEVISPPTVDNAGYWLNTSTGVRHNSGCRWYDNTTSGKWCGPGDGSPCGQCGG